MLYFLVIELCVQYFNASSLEVFHDCIDIADSSGGTLFVVLINGRTCVEGNVVFL